MPKKTKAKLTVVGQLLKAIRTVDRPGTVCTGGDLPLVAQLDMKHKTHSHHIDGIPNYFPEANRPEFSLEVPD